MYNQILQQILRLLHRFCIETDIFSAIVTAIPFCFHSLEEVARNVYAKLGFLIFEGKAALLRAAKIYAK